MPPLCRKHCFKERPRRPPRTWTQCVTLCAKSSHVCCPELPSSPHTKILNGNIWLAQNKSDFFPSLCLVIIYQSSRKCKIKMTKEMENEWQAHSKSFFFCLFTLDVVYEVTRWCWEAWLKSSYLGNGGFWLKDHRPRSHREWVQVVVLVPRVCGTCSLTLHFHCSEMRGIRALRVWHL